MHPRLRRRAASLAPAHHAAAEGLMNDVRAEATTIAPGQRRAGEVILGQADALACDLIVKGAYTQSRLRQMIFGGTTQHILTHATVPVLLAH